MKLSKYLIAVIGFIVTTSVGFSQIPEKAEFGHFAITNATIHTVTNGLIENGTVLIDGTNITFVGKNAKITDVYQRIDGTGKHVYPGLIDSGTQLGLTEIGAVAVTRDQAELGSFNPHVKAFTAINPNSASIPVTRVNGVTTVISHPVSGRISGKAALVDLYGYTPDSMAVMAEAGMYINWPGALKRGSFDDRKPDEVEEDYKENLKELDDFIAKARFYHEMMTAFENDPANKMEPEKNRRLDAMRPVVGGDLPLIVSVNQEKDIKNAIAWIKENNFDNAILSSVEEGWRVADKIAEADLPVLVGPVLDQPARDYEHYQQAYRNASLLNDAGVLVAIRTGDAANVRNLNYNAGFAAAYGMGRLEAMKAVTINPAKIFGVEDKLGSIEAGKQANLIISDGDPFEPLDTIEQVFIRGYKIPMESRHTKLFEQFLNRGATSTN